MTMFLAVSLVYHPKAQRPAFVTPRSLELASHWLWAKDKISGNS